MFAELVGSLRQWFNSTCSCDGYNNLYNPHLTCLDEHIGNIISTVHHYGLSTAQELIQLATADIQMRDPPVVYLSHGWVLCLNVSLNKTTPTVVGNDESLGLPVLITVGATSFCTVLALIFCVIVGLVYIKHKRYNMYGHT